MILKKGLAIGVIALLIGITYLPLSDAAINETEPMIPIELSVMNADGTIATKMVELSEEVLRELIPLLESFNDVQCRGTFFDRLSSFFNSHPSCSGLKDVVNLGLLATLPGTPIFSYGKGRSLITRYHGRVMVKKLITVWDYPDGIGATVIWGNGLALPPTQILLMRQMGFMIGFVGLYVYIPPLLQSTSSTFFMGSALFAYGVSI